MISAVGGQNPNTTNGKSYHRDEAIIAQIKKGHDRLIESNPVTNSRIFAEKFANACTIYPANGLSGSKNANFYQFLTMGMVPYTIGSLMMMAVFNGCTKFFKPAAQKSASRLGHKMAMGVLLYGLFKTVSKKFIEIPVKAATGVDVNATYLAIKPQLPEHKDAPENAKAHEYHKVFESIDFPRWDLLYSKEGNRNEYYDKVAKKMGYGENHIDSDQLVKPEIKDMIVRTRTATTLSSFIWAGLGVALAAQDDWLRIMSSKNAKGFSECKAKESFLSQAYFKEIPSRLKTFAVVLSDKVFSTKGLKRISLAARRSFDSLYNGGKSHSKVAAYGGRTFVWAAVGSSVLGAINAIYNTNKKSTTPQEATIDYNREYTVS